MTSEKLIEFLAQIVVLSHHNYLVVGVLVPSMKHLKDFSKALDLKLAEVPDWLMPTIECRTQQQLRAASNSIIFECNFINFKGRTLDALYVSDSFNTEQRMKIREYILPCLGNHGIIYFEDNSN